jgi:ABC-2 type transport system permease protein
MGCIIKIAQKEFMDLISSRIMMFIIVTFLIYLFFWAYDFYNVLNGGIPGAQVMYNDNLGIAASNSIFFLMCWFGTILGVIIGCSTISSERIGNALNTLTAKPVYRDTIINAKIIGSLAFLTVNTFFFIIIYTSIIFIFCGNSIAPFVYDYFSRLPFVFLFIMAFILVFLSLSMFISLIVKEQVLAMILSTITVYISNKFSTTVSNNLNNIFPENGLTGFIASFSPYSLMWEGGLQSRFMDTRLGALDAFIAVLPDLMKLSLLIIVTMALNYIIFVRRDIG